MRTHITQEELDKVRKLDALTYFQNYRPDDIQKNSRSDYILIEHDSLHFSNGKWFWWSKGVGGSTALDYLIKVEGKEFIAACDEILTLMGVSEPVRFHYPTREKTFRLPEADNNNKSAFSYLVYTRKIDKDIVNHFMKEGLIYQDKQFKNVVFVGKDGNIPKYAFKRSTFKDFKADALGSDKAFSFSYSNPNNDELNVFEAAIDMLSYMSIRKMNGEKYLDGNYLSLAGASKLIGDKQEADLPISLKSYLDRNSNIKTIIFRLDNDEVGIGATEKMMAILKNKYNCIDKHPLVYKDINEELIAMVNRRKELER